MIILKKDPRLTTNTLSIVAYKLAITNKHTKLSGELAAPYKIIKTSFL